LFTTRLTPEISLRYFDEQSGQAAGCRMGVTVKAAIMPCGSAATAAHLIGAIGPMWMLPPASTNSSMCGHAEEGVNSSLRPRAGLPGPAVGRRVRTGVEH
jgi:hypothetical protein